MNKDDKMPGKSEPIPIKKQNYIKLAQEIQKIIAKEQQANQNAN